MSGRGNVISIRVTQKPAETFAYGRGRCGRCGVERGVKDSRRGHTGYCNPCVKYARADGWIEDDDE